MASCLLCTVPARKEESDVHRGHKCCRNSTGFLTQRLWAWVLVPPSPSLRFPVNQMELMKPTMLDWIFVPKSSPPSWERISFAAPIGYRVGQVSLLWPRKKKWACPFQAEASEPILWFTFQTLPWDSHVTEASPSAYISELKRHAPAVNPQWICKMNEE